MGEVLFLFIGGPHHVLHLAPVAAALARARPDLRVVCIHEGLRTAAALERVRAATGAGAMAIEQAPDTRPARLLHRMTGNRRARKGPVLAALARRTRGALAVVTAERTSAALRLMGVRTRMVQFRHGAGDRAPASERRLRCFDLVVVPGVKDMERAVARAGVPPERIRIAGYVKLDHLHAHAPAAPALAAPAWPFAGGRPLVLYNPHFDPALSSWPAAAAIVERFARQDRYDLVLAPHARLGLAMDAAERARWHALAVPGRIAVDLDSDRLFDMTWTLAADIYLGDVSSQLYEFLVRPRPAAFVDLHRADWRADPRYAGWHLGAVTDDPDAVIAAIDRAVAGHPALRADQAAAVARAFGDYRGAAARGAAHVARLIGPPPEKRRIAKA